MTGKGERGVGIANDEPSVLYSYPTVQRLLGFLLSQSMCVSLDKRSHRSPNAGKAFVRWCLVRNQGDKSSSW